MPQSTSNHHSMKILKHLFINLVLEHLFMHQIRFRNPFIYPNSEKSSYLRKNRFLFTKRNPKRTIWNKIHKKLYRLLITYPELPTSNFNRKVIICQQPKQKKINFRSKMIDTNPIILLKIWIIPTKFHKIISFLILYQEVKVNIFIREMFFLKAIIYFLKTFQI